jgi:hypothetical protein
MAQTRDRIIELVKTLTQRTIAKSIQWQVSDDDGLEFQFSSPTSSVVVRSKDRDGASPFILDIINANGAIVESVYSNWGDSVGETPWGSQNMSELLGELFVQARRNALNIDGVLDDLLGSLRDAPPF